MSARGESDERRLGYNNYTVPYVPDGHLPTERRIVRTVEGRQSAGKQATLPGSRLAESPGKLNRSSGLRRSIKHSLVSDGMRATLAAMRCQIVMLIAATLTQHRPQQQHHQL